MPLTIIFYLSVQHLPSTTENSFRSSHVPRIDAFTERIKTRKRSSASKSKFDYKTGAVFRKELPHLAFPVTVTLMTTDTSTSELGAALQASKYLQITEQRIYNSTSRSVYITSQNSTAKRNDPHLVLIDWHALQRDCHILRKLGITTDTNQQSSLLYWDSSASWKVVSCPDLETGYSSVTVAKRSLVQHRYWNTHKHWVERGHVMNASETQDGFIQHAPLALRPSFLRLLPPELRSRTNASKRKTDVSFFWRKGDNLHYSFLRQHISYRLEAWKEDYRVSVRVRGDEDDMEAHPMQPQEEYIQQLLTSKIVVVTQHDEWEDTYLLMEALAGGALVLVDSMRAPPRGLQNGTNCIVYDNAKKLDHYIEYYLDESNEQERLSIAQRGWAYALGTQRLTHRLEASLFGNAMTYKNKPLAL